MYWLACSALCVEERTSFVLISFSHRRRSKGCRAPIGRRAMGWVLNCVPVCALHIRTLAHHRRRALIGRAGGHVLRPPNAEIEGGYREIYYKYSLFLQEWRMCGRGEKIDSSQPHETEKRNPGNWISIIRIPDILRLAKRRRLLRKMFAALFEFRVRLGLSTRIIRRRKTNKMSMISFIDFADFRCGF